MRPVHALSAITMTILSNAAMAQLQPLETTAGWKRACETSPGNRVVLNQDISVKAGGSAAAPELVNTACTIVLMPDAEIQFDKVGMRFAGPLVITGGGKTGLAMQEATLSAPSVDIGLTGDEGMIKMLTSRVDATAGPLKLSLGRIGKMEILGSRTGGLPLTNASFVATGRVSLTAGERFTGSFKEMAFVGGTDLAITGNGSETEFLFENSGLVSFNGPALVLASAPKSKLSFSNSSVRAGGDVDLATGQAESGLSLSNTAVTGGGRVQVYGAGFKSEVSLSNGSVSSGASGVFISAAAGNLEGSLKVEGVGVTGGSPVRLVTGRQGKTIANNNRITSSNQLDISSDPVTGFCEAVGNRITAPAQRICR